MRYFSTFSGIGGFEIGIHNAFNKSVAKIQQDRQRRNRNAGKDRTDVYDRSVAPLCVGYSEIDKYASSVYEYNFKGAKNYGDITKINANELPDFECLVGGFPCQAFSIAGKRAGFADTRGTLFFDLARILHAKQPRLFVFENVKGLLSHDGGQTFKTIIETIDELGYDCQWQVLNSKNHGVPQNRERIIIVGHLRGTTRPQVFPITRTVESDIKVYGELNSETWKKRHESIRRVHSVDGISPTIPTGTGGGVMNKVVLPSVRYGNGKRRLEHRLSDTAPTIRATQHKSGDNQPKIVGTINRGTFKKTGDRALTITANYYKGHDNHGQRPMIKEELRIRRLTPLECERLQAFPDNWTKYGREEELISDTQRYKMCGNAVTTNVIQAVFERIFV